MCIFLQKKRGESVKVKFTVVGEPVGKGRPRFVRTYRGGRAVTPQKTRYYEDEVRMKYQTQCGHYFEDNKMLRMYIDAFFAIPKSTSKKRQKAMIDGEIRPTKKPDMDNIIKIIADALNNVAYYDDKQVVECTIKKYYSTFPRVEVEIYDI